jgi:Domain of unknown function (DUF4351)
MSTAHSDQDSPWKDVLRQYFPEAMSFFFPATAKWIDWRKPVTFLDKEFQQIAIDAEIGRRYADQLVKVWRKRGKELFLLLHVEVQAKPEADFSERMLIYNLRIFNLFHHPAISLAILCDGNQKWRPNRYEFEYPDTHLLFEFGTVKLLDYQQRWNELEQSQNPFAMIVMAHLKAQETKKDAQSRKLWKFQLIRRLYEQDYNRRDIVNLFKFIDWAMILPEDLKQEFWIELKSYEEERRMPYITSVEKIGFERGRQEGERAERSLVLRQLSRRVGTLPEAIQAQVIALPLDQLESLGEALLDFTNLADLEEWLTQINSR